MSPVAIPGPLVQLGLVVPSLDAAIDAWVARGVGPFFEMASVGFREAHFRGRPIELSFDVAFAYSGEIQVELITPRSEGPNSYREFLAQHPVGGLHHLAHVVTGYDATLEAARARGTVEQEMVNALGMRFAYVDRDPTTGALVELLESNTMLEATFRFVREAARGWDGREPRRRLGGRGG